MLLKSCVVLCIFFNLGLSVPMQDGWKVVDPEYDAQYYNAMRSAYGEALENFVAFRTEPYAPPSPVPDIPMPPPRPWNEEVVFGHVESLIKTPKPVAPPPGMPPLGMPPPGMSSGPVKASSPSSSSSSEGSHIEHYKMPSPRSRGKRRGGCFSCFSPSTRD